MGWDKTLICWPWLSLVCFAQQMLSLCSQCPDIGVTRGLWTHASSVIMPHAEALILIDKHSDETAAHYGNTIFQDTQY